MLGRLRAAMGAYGAAERLEDAGFEAAGSGVLVRDRERVPQAGREAVPPVPSPRSPAPAPRTGIGPWEPHWLGEPSRHLYASLHRAQGPAATLGVLFVPPMFHELTRSRRMLAEVASGFAAMGLPTLRFDYFGTGDSGGSGEQADFTSMCADIDLAARMLRAKTGVEEIALVAWRGGALPAARWIEEGGVPSVVVLWEPILDGGSWMQALRRADAAERRSRSRYLYGVPPTDVDADDGQLMGVAASARLRHDIEVASFDPLRWQDRDVLRVPECWAVQRAGDPVPAGLRQRFEIPAGAPEFDGRARMDAGLFVTPPLKQVADAVGRALTGVA